MLGLMPGFISKPVQQNRMLSSCHVNKRRDVARILGQPGDCNIICNIDQLMCQTMGHCLSWRSIDEEQLAELAASPDPPEEPPA